MSQAGVKVVIAGAAGRMGRALVRCCQKVDGVVLAGAIEHGVHPQLGEDAGMIAGIDPVGIALTADFGGAVASADVVIDFSLHAAVPEHARCVAQLGRAFVLGTTGLSDEEARVVHETSAVVPVVWAPNMSPGVNVLFAMAERATALLGSSYRVTIDDTHHIHKKDAPSGTALRLGEKVAEGAGVPFDQVYIHDEGGQMDSYPAGSIAIRSYREGEVVGDHTVCFDGMGESVSLTHHAKSRDAFALGALQAAEWVVNKAPRLYDMQDVLGLRSL
ncbi:MAG: 4-hydroxy-tetrahydrodipicolinate reductase [Kiritimatiellia bacterium]